MAITLLLWFFFAVFLAAALTGPRRLFAILRAPFLKHPEANEPSDLAYRIQGGFAWLCTAVFFALAVTVTLEHARDLSAEQVEDLAWDIKIGMDGAATDNLLEGPTPSRVAADLDDGDKLKVTHVGYADDLDYYEITNRGGDHPWCLTVETIHGGMSTFPRAEFLADVEEGVCEVPEGLQRPPS